MRHRTPLRARQATACRLALALLMLAATLAAPSPVLHADTHTVGNTADSGAGSLRQAIAEAESGDTITFAPSLAGQTITLTSAELLLGKDLTIDGSTLASPITISGANSLRVFSVAPDTAVTLSGLRIVDGNSADDGGGIRNQGTLTVTHCDLSGNSAQYGGGIYNLGGVLSVMDSTLTDNTAAASGGGILGGNALTVTRCILSGNSAQAGGGIYGLGTQTVTDSTLSDNVATLGGGIYNQEGTLTVTHSVLSGNVASPDGFGGGILNSAGILTVTDSTFAGNSAGEGGGIYTAGPVLFGASNTTVMNSTFSGNTAVIGGGISGESAMFGLNTITVANSTFYGNSATQAGGIANYGPTANLIVLEVTNSTFSSNSGGGAAGIDNQGILHLRNTILANATGGGADLRTTTALATNAANLIETCEFLPDGCGITLANVPDMGPLADHGGPTLTLALGPDSPALNAGDSALCTPTDQRGVPRPQGAGCDIGAYEASLPAAVTGPAASVTVAEATLEGTVTALDFEATASFDYGLTTAYGSTAAASPGTVPVGWSEPVSATLSGLLPNTTYHYRVVAVNDAGTASGEDRTFTTAKLPPTASTGSATDVTASSATLHGTVNARNDATTVTFEYGTDADYGLGVVEVPSPVTGLADTAVSAMLTGLQPNTTYHYRVVAVNGAGTVSGEGRTFTTEEAPPEPPDPTRVTHLPLVLR